MLDHIPMFAPLVCIVLALAAAQYFGVIDLKREETEDEFERRQW